MLITFRDVKEIIYYTQREGYGVPGVVVCPLDSLFTVIELTDSRRSTCVSDSYIYRYVPPDRVEYLRCSVLKKEFLVL